MTPLQEKFLKAIEKGTCTKASDILISKASEQICIEEKIELLDKLINWVLDGNADGKTPMLNIVSKANDFKSELQNQLKNLK